MGMGTLAMAKFAGAEVGIDPSDADFGKIRVGNTRVDIWGGLQQMARTSYLVADGLATGEEEESLDALLGFARNKLSPGGGFIADVATGETAVGEKVELGSPDYWSRFGLPLAAQGFQEALQEHSTTEALLSVSNLFGTGTQTYSTVSDVRDEEAQAQFGKNYSELLPTERRAVDESPSVEAKKAERPPSAAKVAADAKKAEFDQEQNEAEIAALNDEAPQPITETWREIQLKRIGARDMLQTVFAEQFSKQEKDQFVKALDSYYAIEKKIGGVYDFDATEVARSTWLEQQLPEVKAWIADYEGLQERLKSPMYQKYKEYNRKRDAAGYFEDGITQQEREQLDVDNPELDALGWYFKGGVIGKKPPSVQSAAAVDYALKSGLPRRPIYYSGLNRPITPDTIEAWDASKKSIENYDTLTPRLYNLALVQAGINKKYTDFNPEQQKIIRQTFGGQVSSLSEQFIESSPSLNAWLVWWGRNIKLHTEESVLMLSQLRKRYGNAPVVMADGSPYVSQMTAELQRDLRNR